MENKNRETINKLRDNAELAMASYGYFHLIGKKFYNKSKMRKDDTITLHDILDSTYANYETHDSTFTNTLKLKGDMTPLQIKHFLNDINY